MAVQMITDSASDLPRHLLDEYHIDVAHLIVTLDGEQYLDHETLQTDELYQAMREGKKPTTSQVPFQQFKAMFEKYAKQQKECIYIALSSGLSGVYHTALSAKNDVLQDYPSFDIDIIDSRSASMGEGFLVLDAARMASVGKSKKEIVEAIDKQMKRMTHVFTVDDLEYLFRGGRINRTSAFVGGLLHIKPVISLNQEGKLVPIEKIRGNKKVYRYMVDKVKQEAVCSEHKPIAVLHADHPEAAKKLIAMMKEETAHQHFVTIPIGSVLGCHTGPGTFATVYQKKAGI